MPAASNPHSIWSAVRSGERRHAYSLAIQRFGRVSPLAWAAFDYLFIAERLRRWWGGPLNGQAHRQRMVREIVERLDPAWIVETGTFRGTSTEFFASLTSRPVFTVELDRQYYLFSKWSLRKHPHVEVRLGDSVSFLRELVGRAPRSATVFFYLDAHWYDHLPLLEELRIVFGGVDDAVVMIDDFQVPGDAGYGFDDYGAAGRLTLDYLEPLKDLDFAIYGPSLPSSAETGARRGSVVLARGPATATLDRLSSLHRFGRAAACL